MYIIILIHNSLENIVISYLIIRLKISLETLHFCYCKYRKIVTYRKLDDSKSITVAIKPRKIFIDFFREEFPFMPE